MQFSCVQDWIDHTKYLVLKNFSQQLDAIVFRSYLSRKRENAKGYMVSVWKSTSINLCICALLTVCYSFLSPVVSLSFSFLLIHFQFVFESRTIMWDILRKCHYTCMGGRGEKIICGWLLLLDLRLHCHSYCFQTKLLSHLITHLFIVVNLSILSTFTFPAFSKMPFDSKEKEREVWHCIKDEFSTWER